MESPRTDPLADRLEACYTGAVYDVLRVRGSPRTLVTKSFGNRFAGA